MASRVEHQQGTVRRAIRIAGQRDSAMPATVPHDFTRVKISTIDSPGSSYRSLDISGWRGWLRGPGVREIHRVTAKEKAIEDRNTGSLDVVHRWKDISLTNISIRKIDSLDKLTTYYAFPDGLMDTLYGSFGVGSRFRLRGRWSRNTLSLGNFGTPGDISGVVSRERGNKRAKNPLPDRT